MNTKRICVIVTALGLVLSSVAAGYAFDHGKSKGYGGGFEEKFCQKASFLMSNEKELALSEEQVNKVKELKLKTKKDMIKIDADIEVLGLEMEEALHRETIDVNAVNALVDQKYELKKQKTKMLVGSYAALKEILTKEQKEKMKELYKAGKEKCSSSSKMKGMMHK